MHTRSPFFSFGFSLLELILVLAIAAVLTALSIRGFQSYSQREDRIQLQGDVQNLFNGLNAYYHATPCAVSPTIPNVSGVFPTVGSDLFATLKSGKYISNVFMPSSVVTQYYAYVMDTGKTQTISPTLSKPIYQLEITADINPNLSATQKNYYANFLDAQLVGTQFVWTAIPNHGNQPPQNFWMLENQAQTFKQQQELTTGTTIDNSCLN